MLQNNTLHDLTGLCFGKLRVISRNPTNSKSGNAMWICKCDCGGTVVVIGSHLESGHTTSCGCNRTSDSAKGDAKERLYGIWTNMKKRCTNPKNDNYKWYGGKGIKICKKWANNFLAVRDWALANGYDDNLTIDRIDVDGNYEPNNCQWLTMKAQNNNKKSNHIVIYQGEKYTITQLAEKNNIHPYTIFNRIKLGWDIDRIINTPIRG